MINLSKKMDVLKVIDFSVLNLLKKEKLENLLFLRYIIIYYRVLYPLIDRPF
jgi:hypothetical protein